MRIALITLGLVVAVAAGVWLLPRNPAGIDGERRTDLPWQITPLQDGTSRVIGLHLGTATLADAIARCGEPESVALFISPDARRSLEVYFGTVRFGPFDAKIIVTLEACDDLLDTLAANAVGREGTRDGDTKLLLAESDKAGLVGQRLSGITYIPAYGGLEADFFRDRERLGEPARWRRVNDHAVSWFYPELGLSLLIDAEGKEAFEYVAPRDFRMPPDAVTGTP